MENNKYTVAFCVWNANEEEERLAMKIGEVFETEITNNNAKVILRDLKVFDFDEECDLCIAFGDVAAKSYGKNCWTVPALSAMLGPDAVENKTKTLTILNTAVKQLTPKTTVDTIVVETPEGITVGSIGADIVITEKEAKHLKKIKDLLGGGKMVITKGDLRIEVEN